MNYWKSVGQKSRVTNKNKEKLLDVHKKFWIQAFTEYFLLSLSITESELKKNRGKIIGCTKK